jgi:predicted nuclease of predicted toxin-antitoxin system
MKLLLDQGLPRGAAPRLRTQGLDVLHVGEIGMARADDVAVLHKARDEGRVVVTLADFHSALVLSGNTSPSVIRIRTEGLRADRIADLLIHVIAETRQALESGSLITVQPDRIRIRKLADFPPRDPS